MNQVPIKHGAVQAFAFAPPTRGARKTRLAGRGFRQPIRGLELMC